MTATKISGSRGVRGMLSGIEVPGLTEAIRAMVTPKEIAEGIFEQTKAMTQARDGEPIPDHRVRLQAWMSLVAYLEGKPIERIQQKTEVTLSNEELGERVKSSPEALSALSDWLTKVQTGEKTPL